MNARQYLIRTVVASLAVIAVVVACNWLVDPYGITGAPRVAGVNASKVDINQHVRLLKKYQPMFAEYDTLIVGKSRVGMGINPEHACFLKKGSEVYNIGVPGAELSTQIAYALNVIYQQDIREVYLSVDFTDFIDTDPSRPAYSDDLFTKGEGDFQYLPSGERNPDYWQVVFGDYLKALFSVDSLFSSIKTIATQGDGAADRTERGFNPGNDFHSMVAVEGAHSLFAQKREELARKYGRPWYFRAADGSLPEQFALLEQFLDILRARNISVTLFVNPLHESFWSMLREEGHLEYYDDWSSTLLKALRARDDERLQFWDFAVESQYIHETVPPPADRSGPLQWFWEPSHYRRELGDLMLDSMLSGSCGTEVTFGKRAL
ncbi:MAG: hypothetical protein HKN19_04670 [Halioglobus sp.]|nr:hypothetical protein [Halioglobus sp.]